MVTEIEFIPSRSFVLFWFLFQNHMSSYMLVLIMPNVTIWGIKYDLNIVNEALIS